MPIPPEGARIEAVVFDLAGTLIDHGCCAPVGVFVELFRRSGVPLTEAQARGPMGTHKRDHIAILLRDPEIAAGWARAHGRAPDEADVDALYAASTPMGVEVLAAGSAPLEGAAAVVEALQAAGIGVGATTGYNREMLEPVLRRVEADGLRLPLVLASDEVRRGRPGPELCWTAAARLGASAGWACVNVGDTPVDMEAGRRAGFWTVGVVESGSLMGLSAAGLAALAPGDRAARGAAVARRLLEAGAHLVVADVRGVPGAIAALNARLASGERP